MQVIAEKAIIVMPLVDLSGLTEAERKAEAGRIIEEKVSRPFNLTERPLIRATLLCMAPEEHSLLLALHHIVSDGWSIALVLVSTDSLWKNRMSKY